MPRCTEWNVGPWRLLLSLSSDEMRKTDVSGISDSFDLYIRPRRAREQLYDVGDVGDWTPNSHLASRLRHYWPRMDANKKQGKTRSFLIRVNPCPSVAKLVFAKRRLSL